MYRWQIWELGHAQTLFSQGVMAGVNENDHAVEDILRGLASQISEREDPFMCSDVRHVHWLITYQFNLQCLLCTTCALQKLLFMFTYSIPGTSSSVRWSSLGATSPL